MFKKNLKGIGLLEAFLAAFVFVIAISSIFATLSSIRKPVVHNEQELTAALAGQSVLEELRSKVAFGDHISTGSCSSAKNFDTHCTHTATSGIYTIQYTVTSDSAGGVRKVDATVSWPDAM